MIETKARTIVTPLSRTMATRALEVANTACQITETKLVIDALTLSLSEAKTRQTALDEEQQRQKYAQDYEFYGRLYLARHQSPREARWQMNAPLSYSCVRGDIFDDGFRYCVVTCLNDGTVKRPKWKITAYTAASDHLPGGREWAKNTRVYEQGTSKEDRIEALKAEARAECERWLASDGMLQSYIDFLGIDELDSPVDPLEVFEIELHLEIFRSSWWVRPRVFYRGFNSRGYVNVDALLARELSYELHDMPDFPDLLKVINGADEHGDARRAAAAALKGAWNERFSDDDKRAAIYWLIARITENQVKEPN
jgi:hypothetical protein